MAKRPSTPPPSQSEVDKAIQHAMDAAASRRERIAMLGGGQKRKDVPRIPGATGHMKVSPEGKQKKKGPESLERDHGADPVVRKLFDDAPAEEAPHVEPAQATLSDSQGGGLII